MLQNPATAPTGAPSDLRDKGGIGGSDLQMG
jgi:hypothetical protein